MQFSPSWYDQLPPECYSWHPSAAPVMSVAPDTAKVFPPPPGFTTPPLYHDQPVFHIKIHRYAKFMQLYELYSRCNRSVAEGALFQEHNPEAGLFDTDKCWVAQICFKTIISQGTREAADTPSSVAAITEHNDIEPTYFSSGKTKDSGWKPLLAFANVWLPRQI
jgi:hypothetical protein